MTAVAVPGSKKPSILLGVRRIAEIRKESAKRAIGKSKLPTEKVSFPEMIILAALTKRTKDMP